MQVNSATTIAIVGAATGIGRAAARKWAQQGASLMLFDVSQERLQKVKEELGDKVETFVGDVKSEQDLQSFKTKTYSKFNNKLDLLFLNAGYGMKTSFEESSGVKELMEINFFGMVHGVSAFLAQENVKPQRIVLTGSKQGITNPPGNPGYNASKAALKSYAEGLSYAYQGVIDVHLLIPGWTFTYLTGDRGEGAKPTGAWTPEEVVDQLELGISNNWFYILCPDNEVTVAEDKKRVLWNAEDIVKDRPALSRWRDSHKQEFAEFMSSK